MIMKNCLLFKLLILAVVTVFSVTSCKDYDDDVTKLQTELNDLKAKLPKQITDTEGKLNTAINAVKAELEAAKSKVADLEAKAAKTATKEELEAVRQDIATAKEELLSKVVLLEVFNSYKREVEQKLRDIRADLDKAATKEELSEAVANITLQITSINTTIEELTGRVDGVDSRLGTLEINHQNLKDVVDGIDRNVTELVTKLGEIYGKVNTRLETIEALLKIVDGKSEVLDKIQTDLSEQLQKIEDNATSIANLRAEFEEYKTKVDNEFDKIRDEFERADSKILNDHIAPLKRRVEELESGVTKLDRQVGILAQALSLNFAILSNRLTSITFIPEKYVNSIPAIIFNPFITDCGTYTPSVTVAYHLSPSYITKEDIDFENIGFAWIQSENEISLRDAKATPPVTATFNKIDNGILYVDVVVDGNWLKEKSKGFNETGTPDLDGAVEKFPSVALQVPLSEKAVRENQIQFDEDEEMVIVGGKEYPESRVITASQYVRLFNKEIHPDGDVYLARNIEKEYPELPKTLDDAKALKVEGIDGATETDPTVVTLPFGETMDLLPEVIAIMRKSKEPLPENYEMKFHFDLKHEDESGKDVDIEYLRGGNDTDQQQFINLTNHDKGTINAKVFSLAEIEAAQGRTPIVRVWMYSEKNPKCKILTGFIKVHLADKPLPGAKHVDKVFDTVIPPCDEEQIEKTISVKWMNEEVYQKLVQLSKKEFHQIYELDKQEGDGIVEEIAHPDQETTDTWLLKWRVNTSTIWNKLTKGEDAKQTITVTYKPSVPTKYPLITITFAANYKLPESLDWTKLKNGSLINKDYWYDNFTYMKHNIFVPDDGETDKTKAVFASNLNTGFYMNTDKSLKLDHTYEYHFHAEQPVMTMGGVEYKLKPSSDGKQLLNGTEVIATINPFVANEGDVLELNRDSETAKKLLNYQSEFLKVRIGMYYYYCETTSTASSVGNIKLPMLIAGKEYFDVVFIRPINAEPGHGKHFVDAVSFGQEGSFLKVSELTNLYDWRHRSPKHGNYESSFEKYPWYYDFYGIEDMTVELDKITTDMDGHADNPVPLSTFPQLKVEAVSSMNGESPNFGFLTYRNNGNNLANAINLFVPVTIKYYWGEIVSTTIKVPVHPTIITGLK